MDGESIRGVIRNELGQNVQVFVVELILIGIEFVYRTKSYGGRAIGKNGSDQTGEFRFETMLAEVALYGDCALGVVVE